MFVSQITFLPQAQIVLFDIALAAFFLIFLKVIPSVHYIIPQAKLYKRNFQSGGGEINGRASATYSSLNS